MDLDRFGQSPIGELAEFSGYDARFDEQYTYTCFLPNPLPQTFSPSSETWAHVTTAMTEIGRLDQAIRSLPNSRLLTRPSLRREANSTTAIEGTIVPLEDALLVESEERESLDEDLREVANFVATAEFAFDWVKDHSINEGFLCDLQRTLITGTSDDGTETGSIRNTPVIIGPKDARIADSYFVPPALNSQVKPALGELVEWINRPPKLPSVVLAALAHYQFETIHPFTNGNGRIGRLVIVLQLLLSGDLQTPLLTVSPWFEHRRTEYYEHLRALSATGDFDAWVSFFADGIESSAIDQRERAEALVDIPAEYDQRLRESGARGSIFNIANGLIAAPVVDVSQLARTHGLTFPAANDACKKLVDLGILKEVTGKRYGRVFVATEVIRNLR